MNTLKTEARSVNKILFFYFSIYSLTMLRLGESMKKMMKEYLHETNFMKTLLASFITRIGDGIDMIAFS